VSFERLNLRFLIDEQLPPGLADRLIEAGHFAEHVRSVGLGGASDIAISEHAERIGAVLITKDEDFAEAGRSGRIAVVWVRFGNVTNRALWRSLQPVLPEIVAAIEDGETLIEVT